MCGCGGQRFRTGATILHRRKHNKHNKRDGICAVPQSVKEHVQQGADKRAAGELEGARPASNTINRRPKVLIHQRLLEQSSILIISKCSADEACQKSPHRTFLTSCGTARRPSPAKSLLCAAVILQLSSARQRFKKLSAGGCGGQSSIIPGKWPRPERSAQAGSHNKA